MKEMWRAHLKDLQTMTERVLNPGAPRSSGQGTPAPGAAPRKPPPTPFNRSFGSSSHSNSSKQAASSPAVDVTEDVALFDDMDLFSGLSLAEGIDPCFEPATSAADTTYAPTPAPPPLCGSTPTIATPKASETPAHLAASSTPNPPPPSAPRSIPGHLSVSTTPVRDPAAPPSPTSTHPGSPAFSTTSTFSSIAPSVTTSSLANPGSPRQALQAAGSGVRAALDENWFTSLADPQPDVEAEPPETATEVRDTLVPADDDSVAASSSQTEPASHAVPSSAAPLAAPPPSKPPAANLLVPTRAPSAALVKSSASVKKSKKKTQRVRVGYVEGDHDDDDEPPLDLGLGSRSNSTGLEAGSSTCQAGPPRDDLTASLTATLSIPLDSDALPLPKPDNFDTNSAPPGRDASEFEGLSIADTREETEADVPSNHADAADLADTAQPSARAPHESIPTTSSPAVEKDEQPSTARPSEDGPQAEDVVEGTSTKSTPNTSIPDHKAAAPHDGSVVEEGPPADGEELATSTTPQEEDVAPNEEPSVLKEAVENTEASHETQRGIGIEPAEPSKEEVSASGNVDKDDVVDPEAADAFFEALVGESSSQAKAAESQVEKWIAVAGASAQCKQAAEQELNKSRREMIAKLAKVTNSIKTVEEEQAVAVEAEDFERADVLNTDLEALEAEQQGLQQQVQTLDEEVEAVSSARIQLVSQQAELYGKLARFLAALCDDRRSEASKVLAEAEQQKAEATGAREAAEGRVDVMQSRISAKHKVLEEEQATLDEKIAAATQPAVEEKQELENEHSKLQAEVEELERQLAAKRAELEASSAKIADVETKVRALASKYDKRAAAILEELDQLAGEEAELKGEVQALAALQEEAARKQQEYDAKHKGLMEEAEQLLAAGAKAKADAESIRAQISDEAGAKQKQAELRAASTEAKDKLQELLKCVEDVKRQVSELAAQCTYLTGEKVAAEEKVAEANRRLPEIEADKKAAAAKKDFKEAARLSAESKAVAAQAEKLAAEAKQSAAQLLKLETEQASLLVQLEELEGMLAEAEQEAGVARWHCLQFSIQHNRKRLEAAVENELYDEADCLQADIDTDMEEAAALSARWNLPVGDGETASESKLSEEPAEEKTDELGA